MLSTAILALSLLPVSLAHFQLTYPVSRGFDDNTAGNFPCGGFNNVQGQRTDYLMSGSPLQLKMGHDQTHVAVYMAVGSDPGSAFNTVLRQQFVVTGLGDFCMGEISIPSGMNISEGTNATIQVVSNADGSGGGLYQCTDVTFRSTITDKNNHCRNNTGIAISQQNISGNPNGTSTSGGSPNPSGSGAAASTTAKPASASQAKAMSWVMGVVGVVGLALL